MISLRRTGPWKWPLRRNKSSATRHMRVKLYLCGGENPVSQYPLGLGYLKRNCETPDVKIEIAQRKKDLVDCDVIGLSSNAWGIREAVEILNNATVPVVIGGQATLWEGLRDYAFRHIVVGEGETAFSDVLRGVEEKVVKRPQIENVDDLKFPERGKCRDTVPILTSRGCPFGCKFCSSKNFWQKARFHSAEYFIDEVEYLRKRYRKAKVLYILDDLFIANKARLEAIHKAWMQRRLHRCLRLRGFIRSGLLDGNTAEIMKEMGFDRVRFGAESGSDRVLKLLGKGTTVQKHQRTIETAHSVGLPVSASFMYDVPGETEEDKRLTEAFLEKNKGRLAVEGWYRYKSFPGTDMYNGENPLQLDMRVR